MKLYAAIFMGQGGWLFSNGCYRIRDKLKATGVVAEVFRYVDVVPAAKQIAAYRQAGYKIVLIGYSLGNTTATYIQEHTPIDLLLCVGMSELAGPNNHAINHKMTKRSVLWAAPGPLSSAGKTLGFDAIHEVKMPHLWMDFDDGVTNGILQEVGKL
jgi:hypothetical protein